MKISNCTEDWNKMIPVTNGKHCDVCNLSVMNLNNKSLHEIEEIQESSGKLCGRISKVQLSEFQYLHPMKRFAIALFLVFGTDTMAYTASAVSYMIENLNKPIVFTGSQLPIGIIRTDGKENLITAIEIASAYENGKPVVPEVCVYFEYKLFRGNRTTKLSANHFNAFASFNYPPLAEAGIDLEYNLSAILPIQKGNTQFRYGIENDIFILKLYPGISKKLVHHFFNAPEIKGVILETFGAGNATSYDWFLDEIKEAIGKGIIIVNVTQCKMGSVDQTKYETGKGLAKLGVISGGDITSEAAITKLMYLLGNYTDGQTIRKHFTENLVGELSA